MIENVDRYWRDTIIQDYHPLAKYLSWRGSQCSGPKPVVYRIRGIWWVERRSNCRRCSSWADAIRKIVMGEV